MITKKNSAGTALKVEGTMLTPLLADLKCFERSWEFKSSGFVIYAVSANGKGLRQHMNAPQSLLRKGHVPKGCRKDYGPVQKTVVRHVLNMTTGLIEQQEWTTNWFDSCPHRRTGGNAVLWGWDCEGCEFV